MNRNDLHARLQDCLDELDRHLAAGLPDVASAYAAAAQAAASALAVLPAEEPRAAHVWGAPSPPERQRLTMPPDDVERAAWEASQL